MCKCAKKEDQGNYRVVLQNPKGSDSADFKVKINDKPEPPEGPLKVSKITPESCKLSWDPPRVGWLLWSSPVACLVCLN